MHVDPSDASTSSAAPSIHIHPHAAHLSPGHHGETSVALEEEDEHDYESLPIGHGWGTNMLAGALAGISEHAAIFPVDSIKVSCFPVSIEILSQAGEAIVNVLGTDIENLELVWR